METRNPIRVLVLGDHAVFREALAVFLAGESDLEIAARCGSVEDALAAIARGSIDVMVLALDLGAAGILGFCALARELGFAGRFLMLTAGLERQEAMELWAGGISGVFLNSSSPELLAPAIRRVAAGETWVDPALSPARTDAACQDGFRKLSGRERVVLMAVYEGLANKQIAAGLQVSEASVKSSLQQIFSKLGVRSRSQLVRVVARHIDAHVR